MWPGHVGLGEEEETLKNFMRLGAATCVAAISSSSFAVFGTLLNAGGFIHTGLVTSGLGGGSGVAIASNWVLTAGHVVRDGTSGAVQAAGSVNFGEGLTGGTSFAIAQVVVHPTDDIALIRTVNALPGFYNINFNVQANQTAIDVVGYGLTANWNGSSFVADSNSYGTRRRGGNVISNSNFDFNETTGFNRWHVMYRYDLDGNSVDSFGDGGPISGGDGMGLSGDSGCGIFNANGEVVSLHLGRQGGFPSTNYGTVGVGIRLADYQSFIQSTVPEPATASALALGAIAMLRRRRPAK